MTFFLFTKTHIIHSDLNSFGSSDEQSNTLPKTIRHPSKRVFLAQTSIKHLKVKIKTTMVQQGQSYFEIVDSVVGTWEEIKKIENYEEFAGSLLLQK
jgi:hypothetical protein